MKKLIFITAVFVLAAASVFADKVYLIQGTYLHTSRTYTNGTDEAADIYGEAGINFTSFSGHGLGFYSSATFLMPISYSDTYNGVVQPETKANYLDQIWDKFQLGLDMLLGPGFLVPLGPGFSLLAGGGLHFNGIALFTSDNYYYDNSLAYNIGPGAAVNLMLNLTPHLNINASGMVAWDMYQFLTYPDLNPGVTAKGGVTWAFSAGIGFKN